METSVYNEQDQMGYYSEWIVTDLLDKGRVNFIASNFDLNRLILLMFPHSQVQTQLNIEGISEKLPAFRVSNRNFPEVHLVKYEYREKGLIRTRYFYPTHGLVKKIMSSPDCAFGFELFKAKPYLAMKITGEEFITFVRTNCNLPNLSRTDAVLLAIQNWVRVRGKIVISAEAIGKDQLVPFFRDGDPLDILEEGLKEFRLTHVSQLSEIRSRFSPSKVIELKNNMRGRI